MKSFEYYVNVMTFFQNQIIFMDMRFLERSRPPPEVCYFVRHLYAELRKINDFYGKINKVLVKQY